VITETSIVWTRLILNCFFQFKISVLAIGTCFVLLVYGVLWDAGEFSWIARNYQSFQNLKSEGFNCTTEIHNFNYNGHPYTVRKCLCRRNKEISKYIVCLPFTMSCTQPLSYSNALRNYWSYSALARGTFGTQARGTFGTTEPPTSLLACPALARKSCVRKCVHISTWIYSPFCFVGLGLYVPYSCELLRSQYYLHAVLGFALACALGLSLFTLFSFVLILKRISQVSYTVGKYNTIKTCTLTQGRI
jgi:hypothetical protein